MKSTLAPLGLIAILLVLTICSIGATVVIWHFSSLASEAVHMSYLYQQAHYDVGIEDRTLDEYAFTPGKDSRDEFHESTQTVSIAWQKIIHDGDSGDLAFVQSVQPEQLRYQELANIFFTLIDAHNTIEARTFNTGKIEPLFIVIEKQSNRAAQEDDELAAQSLATLGNIQQIVISSTVLIFVLGLSLLVLLWKSIRRNQGERDKAAQAELWRMEQTALTDPLTGLPNHRDMMDRIEQEIAHSRQMEQACAIAFIDLDHFKHINDTWGHRVGDAVLREAGRRLTENIRPQDAVGRYGGEEFILVLANTNLPSARQVAERLCLAFAEKPCIVEQGENTQTESAIPITASIGVAAYREHGTSREALIEAADQAMYSAKQRGRNQVCVAGEETALAPQVIADMPRKPDAETIGIKTLTAMASIHDGNTSAHAHRMVRLSEETARRLGRSEEEIHLVRLAALVHDIGKIGIPDAILQKPGPLTEEEWMVMRRHPVFGQYILKQVGGVFELLSHIVVAHHERWDGHGYPHGLSQHAIPLGARIITVVDSYDAMISQRPYREPLTSEQARVELHRCAGSQYDPEVVEAFLAVLDAEEHSQVSSLAEEREGDVAASGVEKKQLDSGILQS